MLFDRVTDSDHRFHFLNELKLWGVQKTKQGMISNLFRHMFLQVLFELQISIRIMVFGDQKWIWDG